MSMTKLEKNYVRIWCVKYSSRILATTSNSKMEIKFAFKPESHLINGTYARQ